MGNFNIYFNPELTRGPDHLALFSDVSPAKTGENSNFLSVFCFFLQARKNYEVSDDIKRLDPSDIANAVIYAATQPAHCAVNEILVEPTDAPC